MKQTFMMLACCGVGLLVGAQAKTKVPVVTKTERLVLVDKDGKEMAVLGQGEGGNPLLTLNDKDGNTRMLVGFPGETGCGMLIYDAKKKYSMVVGPNKVLIFADDGKGIKWSAP
jgi:hypothetical protein